MIIFGRGHTSIKEYGPTFKYECGNCEHEEYFNISRIRIWFTLFFIPIFPYESYYFLDCPRCNRGTKLNYTKAKIFVQMAKLNKKLIDGKITEDEFITGIEMLGSEKNKNNYLEKNDLQGNIDKQKEAVVSYNENGKIASNKKCVHCDEEIKTAAKKCKYCRERQ